ncbi:Pal1 family protein [Ascoidea rubescens DSM 1968]|uniref:Pal1-domain-containing protein n=1 Tax=Ascoidea rubescens DSM 1968 TaxID=1344418 RepID=A0A1D2V8J1_9ASCO|nr:Pal1-domain-containing protein [Ascoidea rubescens DSM 1968]XP_020044125.1 Pal1-domain-containing protein [Ascoidea rubescens DSM 1968]ODV57815.1 Pal1-domain-containing protein [Ascoidea rubescens DSM 1968]ODV57818.1 Pal1-domain-containing protein [Ascoidea rubescens DSM 1968]
MPPPPRPISKNPFADALYSNASPASSNRHRSYSHSSIESFSPDDNIFDHLDNDLPPSYDEVAGSTYRKNSYPSEKNDYPSSQTNHKNYNSRSRSSSSSSSTNHSRNHSGNTSRNPTRTLPLPTIPSRQHRSNSDSKIPDPIKERSKKNPKNKNAGVDTIDRLDVSGLFGAKFHHDGPFDACTPHRNKNTKVAPVAAFPIDGPNSTIKGLGPNNTKDQAIDIVMGNGTIDDDDTSIFARSKPLSPKERYAALKSNDSVVAFDAKAKAIPVHGATTMGLGSSTFLDGAPASQKAAQENFSNGSALTRKKTLSRKFRGNNNSISNPATTTTIPPRPPVPPRPQLPSDSFYNDDFDQKSGLLNRVKTLKLNR